MTRPLGKFKSSLRASRIATTVAFLAFASSLLVSSALVPPSPAQSLHATPQNRITSPIVDSDGVSLIGNVHPLARPEFDRGVVADETRLERMVLLLAPDAQQQRELDALTGAQQEPSSPSYHQWLTPAEYGARFGASTADIAKITAWLTGCGFRIDEVPAGHRLILFSGNAAQVADTFHTEIHRFSVNGEMHLANTQDPQIPRALASVVSGILSLHDFRRTSAIQSKRLVDVKRASLLESAKSASTHPDVHSENTQGSAHYLFPADFATIYDLNPQYAAGKNGAGTSIAIVGRSNINLSDVSSFRSYTGLPANQPTVTLISTNPGLVSGDQDESTLDVEWSGATAPGATVNFVVGASTASSDGVDLSAQFIVNHNVAPVMSTSYGSCEAYMGSGEMSFYNSLWQQAAAEGISSFVSSGDSGAAGCNSGNSSSGSGGAVNGLCSSPYSTCVGGTEFNEGSGSYWSSANGTGGGSALGYIPEKVWNESASQGGSGLWASGGGASIYYAQPSWQAGVAGANHDGMRLVPDVAVTAASHDGYLINENGSFWVIAGTSAASPSYAGIMALVVENQGGTGQGNANPGLYGMLNGSINPFHETPSGSNTVPGVTGFTASGAAYNLATGLGSVDANELVSGWASVGGGGGVTQGFTLRPSVTSEALLPGRSTTFTVAVSGTGGFTGTAALTASGLPSGVTLTFSPSSVKAGASATATLTVAGSATPGASNITITGASGGLTATTNLALTVQSKPTLGIAASSAQVTLVRGESATLIVPTATGGSFTGTVALSVTGLPAGVTAALSPANFQATGSTSTPSTMTLKATTAAALSSSNLIIKATGDGLSTQIMTTVQVIAAPAVTLALSPASINMQSMGTETLTATVSPVGGVSLASSASTAVFKVTGLPAGIVGAWGETTLTASGTLQSQLTLTGGTGALASSSRPVIAVLVVDSASGNTFSANSMETLVVTHVAATLLVRPTASKITLVQGQSGSVQVTATVGGSYSGPVRLGVTGLPAGVTATWQNGTFIPSGPGSTTATLTLTSSTTAIVTSTNFSITATGDGVTSQAAATVQVTQAPAIKLALSPASISMKSNASQGVVVTISPIGGANLPPNPPASSFQITGLPTGILADWGATALTSNGALQVNLTIQGSSAATTTNTRPTLIVKLTDGATGASYTASVQASLAVTLSSALARK